MVVYTCPICGRDLTLEIIATYPPKHLARCVCGYTKEYAEERIERIALAMPESVNRDSVKEKLSELIGQCISHDLLSDADMKAILKICTGAIYKTITRLEGE